MAALQHWLQEVPDGEISDLARSSGVSFRQILRLRNGKAGDARVTTLARLAKVLKTTPARLISRPRKR